MKINKTELRNRIGFSSSTLAKMGKDEYVSMQILDDICNLLDCPLSDVVEHVSDNKNT